MAEHDFGAGLGVDELVGLAAWHIDRMRLPSGRVFKRAGDAARVMVRESHESYLLVELWEDGHTVWQNPETGLPAVITPGGLLIHKKI